jgi:hypothetical protein
MTDRALLAITHLRLRLLAINGGLRLAVAATAARNAKLDRPELARVCVTDRQVAVLLDQVDELAGPVISGDAAGPADVPGERELRQAAARAGERLPLDELAARFELDRDAQDALLLVGAPEVDPGYERIFAYVLDDLGRRLPCVELLAGVGAGSAVERLLRRGWLGPTGTLRRCGLVLEVGDAPTDARQELRLAAGLLDFLLGVRLDLAAVARDPAGVEFPPGSAGPGVDPAELERVGDAVAAGSVGVVAVWGGGGHAEVVAALAARAGRTIRRLDVAELPGEAPAARMTVRSALRTAAATSAVLWVLMPGGDAADAAVAEAVLAEELACSSVPAFLTGPAPWRPPVLFAGRPCLELEIRAPTHSERLAMWTAAVPGAGQASLERLAAHYRLDGQDMLAVASVVRAEAAAANGHGPASVPPARLERAAAAVAQRRTSRLASTEQPRRSPEELILPAGEHRQVMEVAAFFDAWPRVAERWGFGAIAGGRGIKVLFTGDPGTGKTLAAEVIASRLGLSLVKTDLSRLVSKWVGETEKNLDAAFREAEASNAVLFFDEADALFGRRGEVEHGTDRWANLEVGYLLQRLEAFDGLAVLASNLRENIDPAFTRRFSIVVHFPRPGRAERARLWRLAFPPAAPLAGDVDLDALADLELTGAGIVAAARTAALLAADAGSESITMGHVVHGLARQYQREARVLRPTELGPYAVLLGDGHG